MGGMERARGVPYTMHHVQTDQVSGAGSFLFVFLCFIDRRKKKKFGHFWHVDGGGCMLSVNAVYGLAT